MVILSHFNYDDKKNSLYDPAELGEILIKEILQNEKHAVPDRSKITVKK